MRRVRSFLTILIMAVMIATSLGIVTAPEADAASGLPKVSSLSASADNGAVTLSWSKLGKKPRKKVKGIAIFRDGLLIAKVGKKAASYTDKGVIEGTEYRYAVKTYKATKKREWFNKKTKKWQKKKPEKKWRGKSRKAYKYSGGKYIRVVTPESASQSGGASHGGAGGNQNSTPGTNPNPGTDPSSGTEPGAGTDPKPPVDPVVVTDPFSINVPESMKFKYNGWNVITLNQGEVKIPLTVPKHVARIEWTESNGGMAPSLDTITHRTANNGKELYLTANDKLSDRGAFGQVKYTGTLVMETGYQYYDKKGDGTVNEEDRKVSFVIVNTIYPVSGKAPDNIHYTYDFKDMQPVVARNGQRNPEVLRVVQIKAENLPDGSHVNIDINELNADSGFETRLLFPTMRDAATRADLELATPQSNWDCMVFRSRSVALDLLKSGSFTMKFPSGRKVTFDISGSNPEMLARYNDKMRIGNQCLSSTELETIRKCVRYSLLNYTYSATEQDMYGKKMGDCIASNSYFVEILNYCGIKASLRFSGPEKGENSNHFNIAVILKDGTKYVVDCTPTGNPSWYNSLSYEWDSFESFKEDDRLITWEEYSKDFIIDRPFGYDADGEVMVKVR